MAAAGTAGSDERTRRPVCATPAAADVLEDVPADAREDHDGALASEATLAPVLGAVRRLREIERELAQLRAELRGDAERAAGELAEARRRMAGERARREAEAEATGERTAGGRAPRLAEAAERVRAVAPPAGPPRPRPSGAAPPAPRVDPVTVTVRDLRPHPPHVAPVREAPPRRPPPREATSLAGRETPSPTAAPRGRATLRESPLAALFADTGGARRPRRH